MSASFLSASLTAWFLLAQSLGTLDHVPILTRNAPSESRTMVRVHDRANLFTRGALRRAREALRGISHGERTSILVETVQSLNGAQIVEVAERRAGRIANDSLFVLIARDEQEVAVKGARRGPLSRLTPSQHETIRSAFLGSLQAGDPDAALLAGTRSIKEYVVAMAVKPRTSDRRFAYLLLLAIPLGIYYWLRTRRASISFAKSITGLNKIKPVVSPAPGTASNSSVHARPGAFQNLNVNA